jgi:hypothetical protein
MTVGRRLAVLSLVVQVSISPLRVVGIRTSVIQLADGISEKNQIQHKLSSLILSFAPVIIMTCSARPKGAF